MIHTFLIDPVPAPRMSSSDRWKKRPVVTRYWQYKKDLNNLCMINRYVLTDRLDVIFYLPLPDSWSRKKKDLVTGKPHTQRPDTDNLLKGFIDCLTDDDCAIWDVHARKYWAVQGRIEVL